MAFVEHAEAMWRAVRTESDFPKSSAAREAALSDQIVRRMVVALFGSGTLPAHAAGTVGAVADASGATLSRNITLANGAFPIGRASI